MASDGIFDSYLPAAVELQTRFCHISCLVTPYPCPSKQCSVVTSCQNLPPNFAQPLFVPLFRAISLLISKILGKNQPEFKVDHAQRRIRNTNFLSVHD